MSQTPLANDPPTAGIDAAGVIGFLQSLQNMHEKHYQGLPEFDEGQLPLHPIYHHGIEIIDPRIYLKRSSFRIETHCDASMLRMHFRAYGTEHYALVVRGQLRTGETIFVSGAAGGVGMAAVDLARYLGATVIAGTSSPDTGELARQQGASHAINYSCEPVRDRLLELTGGRGVDVYLDTVGGALFSTVSRAMAWGGRMLPIGFTSGEVPTLAMNLPLLKNYSVIGCYWGAWTERETQQSLATDEELFDGIAKGTLRPQVPEALPMSLFADGLHRIASRQATGRIVLRIKQTPSGLTHVR